jgi:hypothetical protein
MQINIIQTFFDKYINSELDIFERVHEGISVLNIHSAVLRVLVNEKQMNNPQNTT